MNNIDIIKDIREIKSNINDINSKMDVVENTSYVTESGSKTFISVDGYADNFVIYGKTEVLTSSGLESEPNSEGANIFNFGDDGLITITSENGSVTDKKIIFATLRGLQNGSRDIIKKVNGVYVKTTHLGQVTFDGSDDEIWNMVGDNFGSVSRFINKDFPIKTNLEVATICDKLNSYPDNASFGANIEGISNRNNGTGFNVQVLKTKLSSNDVEGFRTYLKSNPITVVYELVESVDEFIPDFNPRVFEGTNTIRIDGGYVRNDITFEVTNCFKTSFDVMKEKLSNADLGINLAFQRGDNVKKMLVDKLISGGANVSTSDTFETLINNMSLGKRWAQGSIKSTQTQIRGLKFRPTVIVVFGSGSYSNDRDAIEIFIEGVKGIALKNWWSSGLTSTRTYYEGEKLSDYFNSKVFDDGFDTTNMYKEGAIWIAFG